MHGEIQSYVETLTGNRIKVVNTQGQLGDPQGRADDPMDVGALGRARRAKVKLEKDNNRERVSTTPRSFVSTGGLAPTPPCCIHLQQIYHDCKFQCWFLTYKPLNELTPTIHELSIM